MDLVTKYNKSQKALNYKIKWIKDNFDIKKLNKIELNGNMICNLMEILSEKFNIEEQPVIDGILENILLSKLNEVSETIISQFKNKFKKYIKENENQYLNYYDLITFYFNFQKEEGISNLCKSKIASLILLPNAETYIQKIIMSTFEEIEIIYKTNKSKYEELINNFGSKMYHKNEPNNIQEMKDYLDNLTKYLKKNYIPIISYKLFNFDHSLAHKVNKYIISKLNNIGENIKILVENENKPFKKINEEQNKIIEEKNSKELEFEKIIRDMRNKEREYIISLEIERKKYKYLENYLETFKDEIQKKINDSEIKLNELMRENNNLKNKKPITSDDISLNGIKSDYIDVKNKLIEYKSTIDNFNNQIFIKNQSNITEKGLKLLTISFDEWTNKFTQLIVNNFNNYEKQLSNYEKDLFNADFEITKLKNELKKEQDNVLSLNLKLDNIKNNLEKTQIILEDISSSNKTKEEIIKLLKRDIENLKKNKEKLEVSLNANIVKYELKKEENEVLLSVFYNVLSKNKNKYEVLIKKLSSDVMKEIERYNNKFVFFK